MDFKPFYNDWIVIDSIFTPSNIHVRKYDYIPVNLSYDFFKNLNFKEDSFNHYRKSAAHLASKVLGDRPALCISGGIDSQAMLQCWLESDIKFEAVVLVFKNDLNMMDVEQARLVCKNFNVKLQEFEIDVIQFLNYSNYEYAMQYQSCSPHFNVHYKLFNILKKMNYTGACCGGDAPIFNTLDKSWGSNFNRNVHNYVQYTKVSNFPVIGNFLGYYPELAWTISLQTAPIIPNKIQGLNTIHNNVITNENEHIVKNDVADIERQRYIYKIEGYEKTGFKIFPQAQKFSGFELVKERLEKITGDGWAFEKRYRRPLENLLNITLSIPVFVFEPETISLMNKIYLENIGHEFTSII